jgi:hypothetical protein
MTAPLAPKRSLDLAALAPVEGEVSRHELARFLAGELAAERRLELEARIANEPALAHVVDEMRAENAAFFATMPFARFEADHAKRRQETSGILATLLRLVGGSLRAPLLGVATAAAALVLVIGLPQDGGGESALDDALGDGIRLKGGAHLGLFVADPSGAHLAADGEELFEGDRVQFVVRHSEQATARVIVGIDGKGAVTLYDVRDLPATTEKGDARARVVDESVILDDAVGAERFFLVQAGMPSQALAPLVERAARSLVETGADLTTTPMLPLDIATIVQSSVHIVKVAR